MALVRTFISFDYDHDQDLRVMLVGQSKHSDTPFAIADWSLKEPLTGDWIKKIRGRISNTDQMIVICGQNTHTAVGVSEEIKIAKELRKPFFLLCGRKDQNVTRPSEANTDKIYEWTWQNLKALVGGSR